MWDEISSEDRVILLVFRAAECTSALGSEVGMQRRKKKEVPLIVEKPGFKLGNFKT